MSSEVKERQVGFDLRDEAHPSETHGINSKGALCLSWEKTHRQRQWLNPRFWLTEKKVKTWLSRNGPKLAAPPSPPPRCKERSLTWLTTKAIRLRCVLSHWKQLLMYRNVCRTAVLIFRTRYMFWARTWREIIVTKHQLVSFETGHNGNASAGWFNGLYRLATCEFGCLTQIKSMFCVAFKMAFSQLAIYRLSAAKNFKRRPFWRTWRFLRSGLSLLAGRFWFQLWPVTIRQIKAHSRSETFVKNTKTRHIWILLTLL